ncbi:MAG: cytochrome C [Sphingobium sp. 66-54]|nr:MAG: cytochrome C [Sphingobium sp. 66-54]
MNDTAAATTVAANDTALVPAAAPAADAPPPAFAQCQSCHSPEAGKNGIGPSLAGVFGTKAAEVAGYDFSPAMTKSGLTWDEATLDRYLKAPQQVVPGTKMTFAGLSDDAKRAAVIAYLKSIG